MNQRSGYCFLLKQPIQPERVFEDHVKKVFKPLISKQILDEITWFSCPSKIFVYLEIAMENALYTSLAEDPALFRLCEWLSPINNANSNLFHESNQLEKVFFCEGYRGPLENNERVATYMRIKKGSEQAYRTAHENVWDSVIQSIDRVRIHNYSIYMVGQDLYSYFEVEDLALAMADLKDDIENQKWQTFMTPLMEINAGIKNKASVYFEEIIHISSRGGIAWA